MTRASRLPREEFWTLKKVALCIVGVSLLLVIFVLFRQRQWRLSGQRAVLIVQEGKDEVRKPLILAIADAQEKKLTLAAIPPDQKITAPFGYGTYSSDAYVGLSQLEDLKWSFLRLTLAIEYGIVIDDIIWTNQDSIGSRGDIVNIAVKNLAPGSYTTMHYWDRLYFLQILFGIPSYQQENIEIGQYLTEEKALDQTRFDRQVTSWWLDRQLRQTAPSVVIHNGSGIPGYASRLSRALSLMGFDVLNVETVAEQEDSELLYSQETFGERRSSWSLRRMLTLFPDFSQHENDEVVKRARADVVIVLGKDQLTLYRRR